MVKGMHFLQKREIPSPEEEGEESMMKIQT
jgi:hypothetical protein